MLKRAIYILYIIWRVVIPLNGHPLDSLWEQANNSYAQAFYQEAFDTYQSIYNQGFGSSDLYYNMGNCAFKMELYAPAILWYERALRLDPKNQDIRYNLDLVRRFCLDKIESQPDFFLHSIIREARDEFSPNNWAWFSLFLLTISAILLLVFFFGMSRSGRRWAFYGVFLVFLFSICAFSLGWSSKKQQQQHDYAIVFAPVASVKSSPDPQGKDLFIIHEGIKIKILDQVGRWGRIILQDRREGWMELELMERI